MTDMEYCNTPETRACWIDLSIEQKRALFHSVVYARNGWSVTSCKEGLRKAGLLKPNSSALNSKGNLMMAFAKKRYFDGVEFMQ